MKLVTRLVDWTDGKKTYILSVALFVFAVSGFVTGQLSAKEAVEMILGSGMVASLRHAIE